ncbi:hypothetical protein DWF04_005840 [Cereibacter sphaeroides f. sp. denitrificans]
MLTAGGPSSREFALVQFIEPNMPNGSTLLPKSTLAQSQAAITSERNERAVCKPPKEYSESTASLSKTESHLMYYSGLDAVGAVIYYSVSRETNPNDAYARFGFPNDNFAKSMKNKDWIRTFHADFGTHNNPKPYAHLHLAFRNPSHWPRAWSTASKFDIIDLTFAMPPTLQNILSYKSSWRYAAYSSTAIGIAVDAIEFASSADRCVTGFGIAGGFAGGAIGALGGSAIALPGPGTWVGGTVGSVAVRMGFEMASAHYICPYLNPAKPPTNADIPDMPGSELEKRVREPYDEEVHDRWHYR